MKHFPAIYKYLARLTRFSVLHIYIKYALKFSARNSLYCILIFKNWIYRSVRIKIYPSNVIRVGLGLKKRRRGKWSQLPGKINNIDANCRSIHILSIIYRHFSTLLFFLIETRFDRILSYFDLVLISSE